MLRELLGESNPLGVQRNMLLSLKYWDEGRDVEGAGEHTLVFGSDSGLSSMWENLFPVSPLTCK